MDNFILKVSCPSRRGVVSAISTYLYDKGCGISDSSQFDDLETETLFMRLSIVAETGVGLSELDRDFVPVSGKWNMEFEFQEIGAPTKVLIMVSKFGHCLNDLLYRWSIGSLPMDIVGVVSNHFEYQKLVMDHGLPFHHIPVTRDTKAQAEAELMNLVEASGAELIVLARYMQILSDKICKKMAGRVINIHHSVLPSFKGALPYKQAHRRGVKLIGATAHYVTTDLDEGPIIEQDFARISHAQSPDDCVAIGRDIESVVLARAVHAHVNHRVFLNRDRTIVFPASPGEYAARSDLPGSQAVR